jgi:hypothetical protein
MGVFAMNKGKWVLGLLWAILVHNCHAIPDALLGKRFNEVSFAATHNGQSHQDSAVQNQSLTLAEQFEQGIRATKIHVWYDKDEKGNCIPFVCHGVTKDMLDGSYLEKVVEKVPSMFQGWARDALKELEPINILVRDACKAAYGDGDAAQGVIQFRHCILDPARRALTVLLGEIKEFLVTHPQEILTVILEDHTNSPDQIVADFKVHGLQTFAHVQDINKEWPTLRDMIKSGKRLVVLFHGKEDLDCSQYPWLHPIWQFAWDTAWEFRASADLNDLQKDIMPKRGQQSYADRHKGARNKLFIVHHFVTPMAGGCKKEARKVNKKSFLQARLERLTKMAGQKPNIVQIDFFEHPQHDILDVMNILNGIS